MKWDEMTNEQKSSYLKKNASLTSSELAFQLTTTKNAIIGFCRRHDIPRNPRHIVLKDRAVLKNKVNKLEPEKKEIAIKNGNGISIMQLTSQTCRWIYDDKTYCGEQTYKGSYCSAHCEIVYDKRKKRRSY
jgi:hypothetical protein